MEATRVQRVMIGRLDTREEIHAAVCYDFELMQLEDIEPNVGERGEIESVLTEDFEPLHGLFRHYTSSSSQEQQLSYLAFCHLVHESELFHLEEDAKILSKVFRAAAGKSSPSLSRGAFFEAVIRLAKVWHQLCQSNNEQELSTSTVLYRVIDKFLLPLYNLLMTGTDTRRALGHPKIQNLMHEYHDKLTRCFVKCQEVAPSRDMTAEVLTKLIRDSGMLCPIDSNEHERVIQAVCMIRVFSYSLLFRDSDIHIRILRSLGHGREFFRLSIRKSGSILHLFRIHRSDFKVRTCVRGRYSSKMTHVTTPLLAWH